MIISSSFGMTVALLGVGLPVVFFLVLVAVASLLVGVLLYWLSEPEPPMNTEKPKRQEDELA